MKKIKINGYTFENVKKLYWAPYLYVLILPDSIFNDLKDKNINFTKIKTFETWAILFSTIEDEKLAINYFWSF